MTIKGVLERATDLKSVEPIERPKKTVRRKRIKKRTTIYLDLEAIDILHGYAFQERRSMSHVIEMLIEENLKAKVKPELLRGQG